MLWQYNLFESNKKKIFKISIFIKKNLICKKAQEWKKKSFKTKKKLTKKKIEKFFFPKFPEKIPNWTKKIFS
jgi:hypothetical protein